MSRESIDRQLKKSGWDIVSREEYVPLGGGNFHCFNDVDGCVFDLTSEQFGDIRLDYANCPEQDRAVHFAKTKKRNGTSC